MHMMKRAPIFARYLSSFPKQKAKKANKSNRIREDYLRAQQLAKHRKKTKWVVKSADFKRLLDRKSGASFLGKEVPEKEPKEYPKTDASISRRRIASKRGKSFYVLGDPIPVQTVARAIGLEVDEIVHLFHSLGELAVSSGSMLNREDVEILAEELGCKLLELDQTKAAQRTIITDLKVLKQLPRRPAVITVMGHVDHGKTTLIDWLRRYNTAPPLQGSDDPGKEQYQALVSTEAGGITQAIGSFLVETSFDDKIHKFCVIDTPGHEAFQQMRERGANVTDIVLLVVAATSGPLETTVQAIEQARRAKATIIVVINKIDAANANPMEAKKQLLKHGITVEELGGKTQCVEVSALHGTNMESLLETIVFQAELLDLHADRECPGEAVCLEAKMHPSLGPLANAIVRWGTMRVGDVVVSGTSLGKIRRIQNENRESLQVATPSTPVSISGLAALPEAGTDILSVGSLKEAKDIVRIRHKQEGLLATAEAAMKETITVHGLTDDEMVKTTVLIIKADEQGTLEAILFGIKELNNRGIQTNVIKSGIGDVNMSDVNLAGMTTATIIAFRVKIPRGLKLEEELTRQYEAWKVRGYLEHTNFLLIRQHDVIYSLLDDVEKIHEARTYEKFKEQINGEARVLKIFDLGKNLGKVLGSHVNSGEIYFRSKVKVLRGEEVVFRGSISSLRHLKEDVSSVHTNMECGIGIGGANNIQEGDRIISYDLVEEAPPQWP